MIVQFVIKCLYLKNSFRLPQAEALVAFLPIHAYDTGELLRITCLIDHVVEILVRLHLKGRVGCGKSGHSAADVRRRHTNGPENIAILDLFLAEAATGGLGESLSGPLAGLLHNLGTLVFHLVYLDFASI